MQFLDSTVYIISDLCECNHIIYLIISLLFFLFCVKTIISINIVY